jgi:hypothetical protein
LQRARHLSVVNEDGLVLSATTKRRDALTREDEPALTETDLKTADRSGLLVRHGVQERELASSLCRLSSRPLTALTNDN